MLQFLDFFSSRVPPVPHGGVPPTRTLPPDSNGSLTTMAKGINDVLNYYINVTDAKASIFIAGSVGAASYLLMKFPEGVGARTLYAVAACFLGTALILCTLVVLPRVPSRNGVGCVFWGHIENCADPFEYRDRFGATASAGLLDEEYCVLNFYTARILGRKIRILRAAILSFLGGVLTALPHYLLSA